MKAIVKPDADSYNIDVTDIFFLQEYYKVLSNLLYTNLRLVDLFVYGKHTNQKNHLSKGPVHRGL
ncbi:MAG: hypothetical protein C5B53_06745 [Candidatus Melainabacteria bacterium]|nr:MAG: hypothetical protein C5B53_06745 [Candidatus Melainabacteria bacterium]